LNGHAYSEIVTHQLEDGTWQVILEVRFRNHNDWAIRGTGKTAQAAAKDLQKKLKAIGVER